MIERTITFIVGDQRVDAPAGSLLRVPAGVMHDFENNTARAAGVFNVVIQGEGTLALLKFKTGGKQTVVVQHVTVTDGGQAVVAGSVVKGGTHEPGEGIQK